MFKINFHSLFFLAVLFLNNPNVLCFSFLPTTTAQSERSFFPDIFQQAGNDDSSASLLPINSSITPQSYQWNFNSSTNTFIPSLMLSGWDPNSSTNIFNTNFSQPIVNGSEHFNDTSAGANNNHSLLIPDASISGTITPSAAPHKQQQSATSTNQDKDHALSEKRTKTYMCPTCNKQIANKNSLNYHLKIHDLNRTRSFQCHLCHKSFYEKNALKKHVERHSEEKPFKCDFCSKSFKTKSEKDMHHRTHTGEKPYQCEFCTKFFATKYLLKRHIRTHTGEKPFKCNICGKGLSSKAVLKEHLKKHKDKKPYKCDLCTKAYASKYTYNEHMKMHDSSQFYTCKYCRENLLYKSEYDNHLRYHEEKNEDRKCHICKKAYINNYNLKQHNKRVHPRINS